MKKTLLKKVSKKQQTINKEYRDTCESDNFENNYCSGCGNPTNLSFSHLIPRSRNNKLYSEKRNIKLHCLQRQDESKGCHQRWEGNLESKKTLLDFEENMNYIKEVDLEYYNLILYGN